MYVILIGAFVPAQYYLGGVLGLQGIVLLAMYCVGAVVAIGVAWVLKKSLPTPAFRAMNWPLTIGRPVVPCTVVTPDVMLKGSAEYHCTMLLT